MPELDANVTAPKGSEWFPEWVWPRVEAHLHNAHVLLPPGSPRASGFPMRDLVGRVRDVKRLADVPAGRTGTLTRPAWRLRGLWALRDGDPILVAVDAGDVVLDLSIDFVRGSIGGGIERVTGVGVYLIPALRPRVGFLHLDQGAHHA